MSGTREAASSGRGYKDGLLSRAFLECGCRTNHAHAQGRCVLFTGRCVFPAEEAIVELRASRGRGGPLDTSAAEKFGSPEVLVCAD